MIRCNRCKKNVDITDPTVRKLSGDKYSVSATCSSCKKPINRTLNKRQIKLLPKYMTDAIDFSTFTDYKDEKTGGILPLLPLLAAIFGGLTAAGSTAGAVANSVLQAKKNEEEQRHNLEVEKIARGDGLSYHEGGLLPIIPLIGAIVAAAKAVENTKSGNGLHEHQGGFIPIPTLLGLIAAAGSTAGKNEEERRQNLEIEKSVRGEGINQTTRTLDEIVNNIDRASDDEKRKLISTYHGLGFEMYD
jgi:hypothetical protein